MIGKPAKQVATRLGDAEQLRSVTETRDHIARVIAPKMRDLMNEADRMKARALRPLLERRDTLKATHRIEREKLDRGITARQQLETKDRASRLRGGVAGVWDRLTGAYAKKRRRNDAEALQSFNRDREQRDDLRAAQLKDRRDFQRDIRQVRHRHATILLGLHRDLSRQSRADEPRDETRLRGSFTRAAEGLGTSNRHAKPTRSPRGPSLDR
jgi:hypothetical protein